MDNVATCQPTTETLSEHGSVLATLMADAIAPARPGFQACSAGASDSALRTRVQQAAVELRRALQLAQESNYLAFEESLQRAMSCLTQDRDSSPPEHRVAVTHVSARGGLAQWQIRRIESFVAANLDRAISVAQLAGLANLSHSHFSRSFRRSFDQTPSLYIASRRIKHAQKLMLTTVTPLGQIAADCGMCDQSHFNRLFKRFVGLTPSAWRRVRTTGVETIPAWPDIL